MLVIAEASRLLLLLPPPPKQFHYGLGLEIFPACEPSIPPGGQTINFSTVWVKTGRLAATYSSRGRTLSGVGFPELFCLFRTKT
jgi:hypothetical protein